MSKVDSANIEVVASFIEEGYEGREILVYSEDKGYFKITEKMAMKIGPIRGFLSTSAGDDDKTPLDFPLVNVEKKETLHKVLEYLAHHVDDPDAPVEESRAQKGVPVSEWDHNYIGNSLRTIFLLLKAADYLDINGLRHLCGRRAANYLDTLSPAEIRKIFNLPDDLTKEDLERINAENAMFSDMNRPSGGGSSSSST